MSTRSLKIVHSASRMIGVQLCIGLGQILYSAVTARVFAPREFGAFAAILSLQGLVTLVATTGLPSYALKERDLGRNQLRSLNILALIGAILSSVVFLTLSPTWLKVLNSPEGSVFVPLMALTVIISPFAAVQSALLRREARSNIDRRILIIAFLLSSGTGLIIILYTHDLWSLAWATLTNPLIVLTLSFILRQRILDGTNEYSMRHVLTFTMKVTVQNVVFYIMYQLPSWIIGTVLGPASMGNFSRAATLTSLPSGAMSSGLSRVLQPIWRHIDGDAAHLKAASEATVLAALFSFPLFGILVATGPELSRVWLGPGWDIAYTLTPLLAIAYGLQIPYVALAGSLEMRGRLGAIRSSQFGMAMSLVAFLIVMIVLDDAIWAGVALVISQIIGLSVLSLVATRSCGSTRRILIGGLAVQIIEGGAVAIASWAAVRCVVVLGGTNVTNTIFAVIAGAIVGLGSFVVLSRWNGAFHIVQRRGISLPKWFIRQH